MSTAINYLNRRFDVLAMQGAQPRGDVLLSQTLFGQANGGQVCTGAQKLAQRWTLEFLTIRGSMPYHMSTRGSDFMTWVRSGRLRSEFDVRAYFNFAAQQVKKNLVNEEIDAMDPEERLQRATLVQIQLFQDSLALSVDIVSLAGTTRQVILPINITPANLTV
jgi:hypothetical protein